MLVVAKATNEEQKTRIRNLTGGHVVLFLYIQDFFKRLKKIAR